MVNAKITPTDNGPYLVEGPARRRCRRDRVRPLRADGDLPLPLRRLPTKPFCDGTHETLNFQTTHRAVLHTLVPLVAAS